MKSFKVLYICTHNRCRSQLYQAVTNALGKGIVTAESAGSSPEDQVNADAVKLLQRNNIATEHLRSKSWNDVADFEPDLIITVCDSAAQEACPLYLGGAIKAHWGLADPSHLDVPKDEKLKAFRVTVDHINRRLDALFDLNTAAMTRAELINAINQISHIE